MSKIEKGSPRVLTREEVRELLREGADARKDAESRTHRMQQASDRDAYARHGALTRERDGARAEVERLRAEVERRARSSATSPARVDLTDRIEKLEAALSLTERERDEARAVLARRTAALDAMHGTPCEQIRHEQEVADLRAEIERLRREREALVETTQRVCAHLSAELDDARAEVERMRSAGVAGVLAELPHRDGHPIDSTR